MTALHAKELLGTLGMMAVQGTVLALLALVVTRGKLRPAFQAAVWLVVIVKFALPWSPALPWSLADLVAMLRGNAAGGPVIVGQSVGPATESAGPSVWWMITAIAWATGALAVLVRANLRERRVLRAARSAPQAPADARALLDELGGRRARLVVGDTSTGPHVVGLLHPIIVVPAELLASHELLRAALLHELAHVRRFDAIGRLVQVIARAAFWWFPIVALASRRLDHARESACDARALEVGQLSRPAYARLLLEMARLRPAAAASLAACALDHRVESVLRTPMRARLGVLHLIALLVWGAIALGGARSAEARGVETCVYSPQRAETLRQAHPEADIDNDGVLSHDEACEFQAELRRSAGNAEAVSRMDEATVELLAEPLCCTPGDGLSPPVGQSCRIGE